MDFPAELLRSRFIRVTAVVAALTVLLGACLYSQTGSPPGQAVTEEPMMSATSLMEAVAEAPATEPVPDTVPTTAASTTAPPPATTVPPPPPIVAIGPPPTLAPLTCLGREPTGAADYETVFSNRELWSGGDIAATVPLGDGRVVWLFGDTFIDGLGPRGAPLAMVRNSLVVQRGGCFWLATSGPPGDRKPVLPAAEPGEWLWPSGGVVDPAGLIHITALRMASTGGAPGWEWRIKGVDVVTLRWSDLALVSTRHAGVDQGDATKWTGGAFRSGDHVYIYGWQKDHQLVARSTLAGFARDRWELLTAEGGWSTDLDRAAPPAIEDAPASTFWVVPHKGGYLASSKRIEMNSDEVSTWWAPAPTGPFRPVGRAAHTEGEGTPWISYAGRVTHLPGAGLVSVWSRNHRAHDPNADMRGYGPRFAAPLAGSIP